MAEHLHARSDHDVLFTTFPTNPAYNTTQPPVRQWVLKDTLETTEEYARQVAAAARSLPQTLPADIASTDIDNLAADLGDTLFAVFRATGIPKRDTSKAAKWWTLQCTEHIREFCREYGINPTSQHTIEYKQAFHKEICKAKQYFWHAMIEGAETDKHYVPSQDGPQ